MTKEMTVRRVLFIWESYSQAGRLRNAINKTVRPCALKTKALGRSRQVWVWVR